MNKKSEIVKCVLKEISLMHSRTVMALKRGDEEYFKETSYGFEILLNELYEFIENDRLNEFNVNLLEGRFITPYIKN